MTSVNYLKRDLLFISGTIILVLTTASCDKKPDSPWRTVVIEKGDLTVEVTASGTVNPHSLVAVGTQVSGTISRIFVDFNSRVTRGQLIMLLDTTFLHAAVSDATASLKKAQAQEKLTIHNAERTKELFQKGLVAEADVDQNLADRESAAAAVSSARAQLDRAKINLAYASIRSPITGVVVNRNVDVGQTVAASFNTPTLFSIADDLSRMQIQASIDEADIGQIKVGQAAKFTVDAYPDSSFSGVVSQVRLQPTSVQNVVTYTVMIDLENPGLILMPGMTANVTIAVEQAHGVLKVPSTALKFTPQRSADKNVRSGKNDNADTLHRGEGRKRPDSTRTGKSKSTRIFILVDGKPKRIPVVTGLSTGGFTAIEGDIQAGQEVLVGSAAAIKGKSSPSSPLGMPRGRMH